MSAPHKKNEEDNDNDSDMEQYSDNEDEREEEIKEKRTVKSKIGPGSGTFHILPIQFNTDAGSSIKASVDAYFESFIKENEYKAKEGNFCQYTTTLRGHPLNGKKFTNVEGLTYYQLQPQHGSIYEVNQVNPINEYYLWQYDNFNTCSNVLNNIEQTMAKLDILS